MPKDAKRLHLIALIFANILALISASGIIFFTNPAGAGIFGVMILYASLGIVLGSFGLIVWQLLNWKKN